MINSCAPLVASGIAERWELVSKKNIRKIRGIRCKNKIDVYEIEMVNC